MVRIEKMVLGLPLHHFSPSSNNNSADNKQNGAGFTIMELIIVASMIVILSAVTFPNWRELNRELRLKRAVYQVSQDLRMAQELTLSLTEFNDQIPKGGYGIHFSGSDPKEYILFADMNDDGNYDSGERKKQIKVEEGIEIKELHPHPGSLTIVFEPPDPTVIIDSDVSISSAHVEITNGPSDKTIFVNKAGMIDID